MKHPMLVMTLYVRDEEDIIRYNIDFHLGKGVEFIIATDNGSKDKTRDILTEYAQKGILHLIDERTYDHNQENCVNRMARIAREQYGADIIFHCDADEFWYPRSGDLKTEILSRQEDVLFVNATHMAIVDRNGFERFPDDTRFAVVRPYIAKDYEAETEKGNFYLFQTPPKVIFKTSKGHLDVAHGNHSVINKTEHVLEGWARDIVIFHYPQQGKDRFFSKVINAGSAYEKNTLVDSHTGFHIKRWYESYKRGTLDKDYKGMALNNTEIARLLQEGRIEEMNFEEIVLGRKKENNLWQFYNRYFEYTDRMDLSDSAWWGHIFFSYDLVRNLKPCRIVELGTHKGCSLFSFCQAVKDGWLDTELYAVDTWKGDKHTGPYDKSALEGVETIRREVYGGLRVALLRKTFDEAKNDFEDGSIDILHIDGYHTYEAVRHDFENWLGKVKQGGIILLHDTAETRDDFGVHRFWGDLKKDYDTFEFYHSHGLGVLCKESGAIPFLSKFPSIWQKYYMLKTDSWSLTTDNHKKEREINDLRLALQQKDWEIEYMKSSKFWKMRSWYLFVKEKIMSPRGH